MDCYRLHEDNSLADANFTIWVDPSRLPCDTHIGSYENLIIASGRKWSGLYRLADVDPYGISLQYADGINKLLDFWTYSTIKIIPNCPNPFQIHLQFARVHDAYNVAAEGLPEGMGEDCGVASITIVAPKKGYTLKFRDGHDAIWGTFEAPYYVMDVTTPNGKQIFLDLKVSQMFPPLDIDKIYRETKLKRQADEPVDLLRSLVGADIKEI